MLDKLRGRTNSSNNNINSMNSTKYQPIQYGIDAETRKRNFKIKYCRRFFFALALALAGFVLIVIGLQWYSVQKTGYTPFIVVGLITFTPGLYGIYEVRNRLIS